MLLANLRTWIDSRSGWEKAAVATWCIVLLFVSVRVLVKPASQTVYPIFSASGRLWWTGEELYEPHRPRDVQDGYRYAPTCAILFTPFAILPDRVGGVLWRLFSAATLLGALAWFVRSVLPGTLTATHLGGMFLLILPLAIQSVNNGQANIVVIAAMLGAVASIRQERWNLAAVLIALAFVCKLYPLALGMMLVLLYPRQLGLRVPVACLTSLLVPFLCQEPAYVVDQYEKWIALVRSEDRADIPLNHMYRDLWLLIHLYGLPISRAVYGMLQVGGGAIVALVCWRRQRAGWPTPALLVSTLALTAAWMMLLGPATESSSFALLAPSFAWSVVSASGVHRTARHGLLWGSCALFAVAVFVGGIAREWGVHEAGFHAWASLCYFVYLLTESRTPIVSPTHKRGMSPVPRLRVGLNTLEDGHRVRT